MKGWKDKVLVRVGKGLIYLILYRVEARWQIVNRGLIMTHINSRTILMRLFQIYLVSKINSPVCLLFMNKSSPMMPLQLTNPSWHSFNVWEHKSTKRYRSYVHNSDPNKKSTANKRQKTVNTIKTQLSCWTSIWTISRMKTLKCIKKLAAGLSHNSGLRTTCSRGRNYRSQ